MAVLIFTAFSAREKWVENFGLKKHKSNANSYKIVKVRVGV